MPYLLADSFGGLGQQAQSEDQNRRLAFANAIASLQQGIQQGRQGRQFQQTLAEQKEQGQEQRAFHARELDVRQQEIDRQIAMDKAREETAGRYAKVAEDTLAWQKTQPSATQQRRIDFDFNAASQDAQRGAFDNPDHVLSMYPTLSDPEAGVMAARSLDARKQHEADYGFANNTAATLNRHNALGRALTTATEAQKKAKAGWFNPGEMKAATATLDTAQKEYNDLNPKVNEMKKDQRRMSLVSYDPDSDSYVPAIPRPSWAPTTPTRQAPQAGPATPPPQRMMPPAGTTTATTPDAGIPVYRMPRRMPLPQDMPPAGPMGGSGAPARSPFFYDRFNYYHSQGAHPMDAASQAQMDEQALFQ